MPKTETHADNKIDEIGDFFLKYRVSPFNNSTPKAEIESFSSLQEKSFEKICDSFTTVLQVLWKYMVGIENVAEISSVANFATLPVLFLR